MNNFRELPSAKGAALPAGFLVIDCTTVMWFDVAPAVSLRGHDACGRTMGDPPRNDLSSCHSKREAMK